MAGRRGADKVSPPAGFSAGADPQPAGGGRPVVEFRSGGGGNRLTDLVGTNIVIANYEISQDNLGRDYAVIETADGRKYTTYSKVVIRQLKEEIKPLLDKGYNVKVSVRRGRRAIYLAPPI